MSSTIYTKLDELTLIVLQDARIYKDLDRLDYLQHWEKQKVTLQEKYKTIDLLNTDSIMNTLKKYDDIRRNIDGLTDILKNMNNLTTEIHRQSNFEPIIKAIEAKLTEDSDNSTTKKSQQSSSPSSSVVQHFHGPVYGVAASVGGNQIINPADKLD